MYKNRNITNFEKLALKTREHLIASKEKSVEWFHAAVDASAVQLEKSGDFTKEEGERAGSFLKRDLAATRVDIARVRESINRGLDLSRVSAGYKSAGAKNNATGFLKESKNITDTASTPGNGEQRKKISEAAYFRALERNFEGGDQVEDWTAAEKELGTLDTRSQIQQAVSPLKKE